MGGETLGIPNGFPMGGLSLCQLTGLCPIAPGCEFGACGPGDFQTATDAIRLAPPLVGICTLIPGCGEVALGVAAGVAIGAGIDATRTYFAQRGKQNIRPTWA